MVWERFVRSASGGVGKQHRAHPGVAARRFRLGHSEPSLASTSLRQSDGVTLLAVWWSIWIRRSRSSKRATQDSLLTHSVTPPSGPRLHRASLP